MNKRIICRSLLAACAALNLSLTSLDAQNPISPMGVYIADPSARVAPDGRLYIYGSRDESDKYYYSDLHDLLSTSDLRTWRHDRGIFSMTTSFLSCPPLLKNIRHFMKKHAEF